MLKLFVLSISMVLANAQLLTFSNCSEYQIIPVENYGNLTFGQPLGYYEAILPIALQPDQPCFEIQSATDKFIEIKAESITPEDARLCFSDEGVLFPVQACGNGQVSNCYMSPGEKVKIQFYCDQNCELSDVSFHYRIVLSEANASDRWCSERDFDEYPSSLNEDPDPF